MDTFGAKNIGLTQFDGTFGAYNIGLTLFDGFLELRISSLPYCDVMKDLRRTILYCDIIETAIIQD